MNTEQPLAPDTDPRGAATCRLRVLSTTDLHGRVISYDYGTGRPMLDAGLSRVATLIREARREEPLTLLFDCGDSLFGTPLTDQAGEPSNTMCEAMAELDYTAILLGNHDFDYGLTPLADSLERAPIPALVSNVCAPALTTLRRSMVIDVEPPDGPPVRVGLAGLLQDDLCPAEPGLTCLPLDETARAQAADLKERGADLLILLLHGNLDRETDLLEGLRSTFDLILQGHNHEVRPASPETREDQTAPIVEPGFWGSHLGLVDISLIHDGTGWRVQSKRAETRPVAERGRDGSLSPQARDDGSVLSLTSERHRRVQAMLSQPVAEIDEPLVSYVALLGRNTMLDLINAAQMDEARQLVGDTDLPLLSAIALEKSGGRSGPQNYVDIPAGLVTRRDINHLYSFPNRVTVLKTNGAGIRRWLKEALRCYLPLRPGVADQQLFDSNMRAYLSDRIYGLRYDIDLAAPDRLGAVTLDGQPLDDRRQVLVATNNFRASGAAGFHWLKDTEQVATGTTEFQALIERRLAEHGLAPREAPFRLLWPANASGWTRTSARFAEHTDLYPDYVFDDMRLLPSGFMRLRIRPRDTI